MEGKNKNDKSYIAGQKDEGEENTYSKGRLVIYCRKDTLECVRRDEEKTTKIVTCRAQTRVIVVVHVRNNTTTIITIYYDVNVRHSQRFNGGKSLKRDRKKTYILILDYATSQQSKRRSTYSFV